MEGLSLYMSDRVSDATGGCENLSFVEASAQVVKEFRLRKTPADKYIREQIKPKRWFNSGVQFPSNLRSLLL
jgi:hypothetical protein